jgi:hypothetical protein
VGIGLRVAMIIFSALVVFRSLSDCMTPRRLGILAEHSRLHVRSCRGAFDVALRLRATVLDGRSRVAGS